jgi:hypothetical protein
MPIEAYSSPNGEKTFVAFTDISGFKKLMKEGKAPNALDIFYNAGFHQLKKQEICDYIDGIFVSDCGIMFARNDRHPGHDNIFYLKKLLNVIRNLNNIMLQNDKMLVTSIAFGSFEYADRIVLRNMNKNLFHGDAYLNAYIDNEEGVPKITPGQCRIIIKGIPPDVKDILEDPGSNDDVLKMVKTRYKDKRHYYFYWMRDEPRQIDGFEKKYSDSYELIYGGMLNALKEGNNLQQIQYDI